MTGYLDSSVLLSILFQQGDTRSVLNDSRITQVISSRLLRIECLQSFHRLHASSGMNEVDIARQYQELHRAFRYIEWIPISEEVVREAENPIPGNLRALDAIHLASALLWSESRPGESLLFLTSDQRLGRAARMKGFEVIPK